MNRPNNCRGITFASVFAVLVGGVTSGRAEVTVVSPSIFEDMEGNSRSQAGRSGRGQMLYPASAFESVPQSHRFITGLAWRPDVTSQFTGAASGPATFRLSTTTADSLTSNFLQNLGGVEPPPVFQGNLTWQTDNDPADGPRDFDYVVMFDSPFEYSGGNLVVDLAVSSSFSNSTNLLIDIHRTGNGPPVTAIAGNFGDSSASFLTQAIYPAQFTFMPSAADLDEDGDVDGDDFLTWQASFGVDTGGDADGDGDTDGDDFLVWQTEFGSGSGSASAAVPEPMSMALVLAMTATAVLFQCGRTCRRSH